MHDLENKGFIQFESVSEALKGRTVAQLKELLKSKDLSITGKKTDLVERAIENMPENELLATGLERKYVLTQLGKSELSENEYVPYMHRNTKYANFTVWDLNKMLGAADKSNFREIINKRNDEIQKQLEKSYESTLEQMKQFDPDGYRKIRAQDNQIKMIKDADEKYKEDKDLDWIINLWEKIWRDGGPIFEGAYWMFRLPDLYMNAKRYDDALSLCLHIKNTRQSYYRDKADYYMKKIEEKKAKEVARRKN